MKFVSFATELIAKSSLANEFVYIVGKFKNEYTLHSCTVLSVIILKISWFLFSPPVSRERKSSLKENI